MLSKYPSIEQFRGVIKQVQSGCDFRNKPYPVLDFKVTPKMHGTNASVAFKPTGEIVIQSRRRTITPESDNAGFATWVLGTDADKDLSMYVADISRSALSSTLIVYGEWCCANIAKGALLELEDLIQKDSPD